MIRTVFAAVVGALLVACGVGSEAQVGPGDETAQQSGQSLGAVVTLRFRGDWTTQQSAALVKGAQARIEYDASRVGDCGGVQNGVPQYSVTAHYVLGDAPEKTVTVAGLIPGGVVEPIALDREGELVVWFEVSNRWGCHQWDSAYGANYRFNVAEPKTITFAQGWSVSAGSLVGAKALAVSFALERLPECRQGYNGLPTWEILAYARFDGGAVQQAVATKVIGTTRVPAPATFAVPAGAQSVELWFMNSDRAGCVRYDSNWGQNYRFSLR